MLLELAIFGAKKKVDGTLIPLVNIIPQAFMSDHVARFRHHPLKSKIQKMKSRNSQIL